MPPEHGPRASICSVMSAISDLDIGPSLADFDWADTSMEIEDFLKMYTLPQIVKVDSGDYGNFGTGTQIDVTRPFLLAARRSHTKVLAASVYWEDSKQQYEDVGHRLVIPTTYKGYFSYLGDFAKVSGTVWSRVEEVAHARPRPRSIIIREPVKCFRTVPTATCQSPDGQGPEQRVYTQGEIPEGDVLKVGDIYTETLPTAPSSCCFGFLPGNKRGKEIKYLQCLDSDDQEILLEFSQMGQFSPVGEAGTNIDGAAYRLPDILPGRSLPVYVKLTYGQSPATPCSFTGLLRLEEVYMEETVIACCLGRATPTMVEFPIDSNIQFMCSLNGAEMLGHESVSKTFDFCDAHMEHYITTMKVVQNFYPEHLGKTEDWETTKGMQTIKGRSLPDLPEITSDSESAMMSDEYTDASDNECSQTYEDINYEIIPHDLPPVKPSLSVKPVLPVKPRTDHMHDEDGYLRPVSSTHRLSDLDNNGLQKSGLTILQSNIETNTPVQTVFMDKSNHRLVLKIENTTTESTDDIIDQSEMSQRHPSAAIHKHHINRACSLDRQHISHHLSTTESRHFTSMDDLYPNNGHNAVSFDSRPPSIRHAEQPDLETREDMHAFLDQLFDYNNMDIEQLTIQRMLRQSGKRFSIQDGGARLPTPPSSTRSSQKRRVNSVAGRFSSNTTNGHAAHEASTSFGADSEPCTPSGELPPGIRLVSSIPNRLCDIELSTTKFNTGVPTSAQSRQSARRCSDSSFFSSVHHSKQSPYHTLFTAMNDTQDSTAPPVLPSSPPPPPPVRTSSTSTPKSHYATSALLIYSQNDKPDNYIPIEEIPLPEPPMQFNNGENEHTDNLVNSDGSMDYLPPPPPECELHTFDNDLDVTLELFEPIPEPPEYASTEFIKPSDADDLDVPLELFEPNPLAVISNYKIKKDINSMPTFYDESDVPLDLLDHSPLDVVSNYTMADELDISEMPSAIFSPHLHDDNANGYQETGNFSTPSSEGDGYVEQANRSDSGIYLSRWAISDNPLDPDESPYSVPASISDDSSWTPPDDLSPLSVMEVAQCLRYIGIKHTAVLRFVEEQVDGKQLQELDNELLREGLPELNAFERKKVIDFSAGWRPKKM